MLWSVQLFEHWSTICIRNVTWFLVAFSFLSHSHCWNRYFEAFDTAAAAAIDAVIVCALRPREIANCRKFTNRRNIISILKCSACRKWNRNGRNIQTNKHTFCLFLSLSLVHMLPLLLLLLFFCFVWLRELRHSTRVHIVYWALFRYRVMMFVFDLIWTLAVVSSSQ